MITDEIVKIKKLNEVYLKVQAPRYICSEISKDFAVYSKNYKFDKRYKNGQWDGKVRLFNAISGEILIGLYDKLINWLVQHNYKYELVETEYGLPTDKQLVNRDTIIEFVKTLKLPFELREYQIDTIVNCINEQRLLVLSPTSSGKLVIIYCLVKYYNSLNKSVLIIVPNKTLLTQTESEFLKYGIFVDDIHSLKKQKEIVIHKPVTVAMWQTVHTMPAKYFKWYDVVIVDEAHISNGISVSSILKNCVNAKYRFGFTGTLPDSDELAEQILNGHFGKSHKVISTKELIENKQISDVLIKIILVKHDFIKFASYHDEIDYIISCEPRNNMICKLANSSSGNTLILFNYVEKHGKVLYDKLIKMTNKNVYYVSGEVDAETRESIRGMVETKDDCIIIASYQTYQVGVSINNLHNVIFASPTKSKVRNLQSVGRGLRLHENKQCAIIYDIADDISHHDHKNYTLNHLHQRIKYYAQENFNFQILNCKIKTNN